MTHTTRNSILLFFVLAGLVILFVYIGNSQTKKEVSTETPLAGVETSTPSVINSSVYEQVIKNALITVPDTTTKISLVDGRASYGTATDGGDVTLIKLIGGEKVSTGATHVFADIAVQSGGTGVFHYVALFDVSSGKPVYLSSHFVGDRVILSSASTTPKDNQSYMLKVQYLDRREGDAMVEEPTVPKEMNIEVKNNLFVENSL